MTALEHPGRCHYRGRLASNNAVFDSSYERGRPLTFKASLVSICICLHVTILHGDVHAVQPCCQPSHGKPCACMSGWLLQVGAGEVIQGWDKGILGTDGIPPMKVPPLKLLALNELVCGGL